MLELQHTFYFGTQPYSPKNDENKYFDIANIHFIMEIDISLLQIDILRMEINTYIDNGSRYFDNGIGLSIIEKVISILKYIFK